MPGPGKTFQTMWVCYKLLPLTGPARAQAKE